MVEIHYQSSPLPVVKDSKLEQLKFRMKPISEAEFFSKVKEMHGLDLKPKVDEEDAPCSIVTIHSP